MEAWFRDLAANKPLHQLGKKVRRKKQSYVGVHAQIESYSFFESYIP
jgi:hypothetical protein